MLGTLRHSVDDVKHVENPSKIQQMASNMLGTLRQLSGWRQTCWEPFDYSADGVKHVENPSTIQQMAPKVLGTFVNSADVVKRVGNTWWQPKDNNITAEFMYVQYKVAE